MVRGRCRAEFLQTQTKGAWNGPIRPPPTGSTLPWRPWPSVRVISGSANARITGLEELQVADLAPLLRRPGDPLSAKSCSVPPQTPTLSVGFRADDGATPSRAPGKRDARNTAEIPSG